MSDHIMCKSLASVLSQHENDTCNLIKARSSCRQNEIQHISLH